MITSLLALGAAAFYGAADFLGGIATRRSTTVATVLTTQGAGLLMLLAGTPLMLDRTMSGRDIGFGVLAGLTGSIGVALLYQALAIGPMSVVAPVTAVCAVIVPLVVGVVQGDEIAAAAAIGVAVAMVAVGLLGMTPATTGEGPPADVARGVRVALASGVAVGGFLVALGQTSSAAGLWPLAVSRLVSVTLFAAGALATRQAMVVPRPVLPAAVACGGLDMVANALYLVAVREGQLSLVATLASLYPASTVLLARVVLGERLGPWQQLGVASAVAAIVLIVGNS
ncbi:MAG: EamA family transporter [Vicinamibacterales bacterium]